MRFSLVPVGHRSNVILQRQITPILFRVPAEGLYGYFEIFLEADRIHDVPAIQTKALLRFVQAVGPDYL